MTKSSISSSVKIALHQEGKPLAIVLAGHNGSGKSTLWYKHIANDLRIPLINADRMMLSILPEHDARGKLPSWAQDLRDKNELWMGVAQKGVEAFVAQAMGSQAAFAMETVFSDWSPRADGTVRSKIERILELQEAGYFVLLMFVGLSSVNLSIGRVEMRKLEGGHDVAFKKLVDRFPRTQKAIREAMHVADATILFDNSRSQRKAFTPVLIRSKNCIVFDIRTEMKRVPKAITTWLNVIAPA